MQGFAQVEYDIRLARAQALMTQAGLAGLLLTTEPEIRYFTGFLTRFWESPSRPWFLIVPAEGAPVAVIPAIGAPLMARAGLRDIRTWNAPDPQEDGTGILSEALRECIGVDGDIGVPMGPETHLRMPLDSWHRLKSLTSLRFGPDYGLMQQLRRIKSEAEIAKISKACQIAGKAFDAVPRMVRPGLGLDEVFRRFQMLCLDAGADWVPYLAGASAPEGYVDVISPATATPVQTGDVLMLDTGLVHDGYFCDFDRNFSIGPASAAVQGAHHRLVDAVDAAAEIARPGATAADLFCAMERIVGTQERPTTGRMGHEVGLQLTEGLSLIPQDHTVLEPGMVLTLEPVTEVTPGRILVHEENIVIRDTGADFLSRKAARDIPEIGAL